MSRARVVLDGGRVLLVGYDRPFSTYFAMLYTPAGDAARMDDEPDKAVGYHPMERDPHEITEHGPYPANLATFAVTLKEWGLSNEEVNRAAQIAAMDPDAPA